MLASLTTPDTQARIRAVGTLNSLRMRAARSCFEWSDGKGGGYMDAQMALQCALPPDLSQSQLPTTTQADGTGDAGAGAGAGAPGVVEVPPLQPFSSLSLPLSPRVCSDIGAAYMQRAVVKAAEALRTNGPLPPYTPRNEARPGPAGGGAGKGEDEVRGGGYEGKRGLVVGFLTPDANGAHPLGQLMGGALGGMVRHTSLLFTMCRHDGSVARQSFEDGADETIDVTG